MRVETGLSQTSRARAAWATIERAITARRGVFGLLIIVLLSLAFRLHVSQECSLWLDEASTFRDVRAPWAEVLKGPSQEHPPLMYVLVRGAVYLFGPSETSLRSVSLFFGCVLLIAAYQLCLELGLSVGRALIATATFAFSPFFIRHATEARHYAILAALVTVATVCVLRVLRGPPRISALVGFAASAAAGAWIHYFGLPYALALLGALLLGIRPVWRRARALQRVALVGTVLGLLALLWFVAVRILALARFYAPHSSGAAVVGVAFNTGLFRQIPEEFSFLSPAIWALAIEPLLALVGLALLTWRLRGSARLLPLGIGAVPCVPVLFISSGHFIAARYLAPSAVFYHLGACVALFAAIDGARSVLQRAVRPALLAPLLGWLVFAGLLSARLWEFPDGFGAGTDDYAALQRYFRNNLAKDTRVVTYYGYFGHLVFGAVYHLGSTPIYLEKFKAVRGIHRYLVVAIHINGDERSAELEALAARKFGISPEAWRALPLLPVAHSIYQRPVQARLVELPSDPSGSEKKPHPSP